MTNEQRDSLLISLVEGLNNVQNTLNDIRTEIRQSEDRTKSELKAELKQTEDTLRAEIKQSEERTKAELRAEIKQTEDTLRAEIKQTEDTLRKEIQDKHMENVKELAQIIRDNGKYEFEQRKAIIKRLNTHEKEIKKLKAKFA